MAKQVQDLFWTDNEIQDRGAHALQHGLSVNKTLTELDLSGEQQHNAFTDAATNK